MKKHYTSKEKLLEIAEECAKEKGISGLGMRDIATRSGLALGTIYNYFQDKESLLMDFFTFIWDKNISTIPCSDSYIEEMKYLIELVEKMEKEFPDFLFYHPIRISENLRPHAKKEMKKVIGTVYEMLIHSLTRDTHIRKDLFSSSITQEEYVMYTMRNIIAAKTKEAKEALLKITEKTLYA